MSSISKSNFHKGYFAFTVGVDGVSNQNQEDAPYRVPISMVLPVSAGKPLSAATVSFAAFEASNAMLALLIAS
jgi:hypothetical protein